MFEISSLRLQSGDCVNLTIATRVQDWRSGLTCMESEILDFISDAWHAMLAIRDWWSQMQNFGFEIRDTKFAIG